MSKKNALSILATLMPNIFCEMILKMKEYHLQILGLGGHMNLKRKRFFYFLLLGILCAIAFQNCQKPKFEVNPEKKNKVLQEDQVFSNDPVFVQPVSPNTPTPSVNNPPVTNVTTTTVPLTRVPPSTTASPSGVTSLTLFNGLQCDQKKQIHKGGIFDPIVVAGVKPLLTLTDAQSGIQVCRLEGNAFVKAMAGHGFLIPKSQCQFVENRIYTLDISAQLADGSSVRMIGSDNRAFGHDVTTDSLSAVKVVYSNSNFKTTYGEETLGHIGYYGYWQSKEICDQDATNASFASPLVIDLGPHEKASKTIEISSIMDGIFFDILGLNSFPYAYAKKKIGWTSNPRYGFLVLPNVQGQVLGIDQMFGDNTLGPDNQFALNGFLALAKYDGKDRSGKRQTSRIDGLISADDDIYGALRLWTDTNYNGYAEPSELKSLAQAEIDFIDLRYDNTYRERDIHGNETTYKSVVGKSDGRYHLIFDLWFVYSNK